MFWVVVAILYFVLAAVAPGILGLFFSRTRPDFGTLALSLRILFVAIALTCLAATSYVHVESDEIAVLNKIYGTTSLPGEHIIAIHGEKGPQAEILTPGWHPWFLVNVIYQVENKKVVSIPSGKYGFLNAKDGVPLRPDQYLADAFPAGRELDMLDAEYFLTHGGERGPQTTVLTPGNYRLNTYLWDVEIKDAVDIPKGAVGVIKSNVVAAVNFGSMIAPKPSASSCQQKRVSANASGQAVSADQKKEDQGVLTAILVPVGCIGVWEQALQPGRYYVNEAAYKVTMISTRVQTWEFKGGYKKRYIDLSLDQAGNLTQSQRSQDIPVPEGAADPAVTPFVEGWLVPLELRVLAQVTPTMRPLSSPLSAGCRRSRTTSWSRRSARSCATWSAPPAAMCSTSPTTGRHSNMRSRMRSGPRGCAPASSSRRSSSAMSRCRPNFWFHGCASNWRTSFKSPTSRSRRRKPSASRPKKRAPPPSSSTSWSKR